MGQAQLVAMCRRALPRALRTCVGHAFATRGLFEAALTRDSARGTTARGQKTLTSSATLSFARHCLEITSRKAT